MFCCLSISSLRDAPLDLILNDTHKTKTKIDNKTTVIAISVKWFLVFPEGLYSSQDHSLQFVSSKISISHVWFWHG